MVSLKSIHFRIDKLLLKICVDLSTPRENICIIGYFHNVQSKTNHCGEKQYKSKRVYIYAIRNYLCGQII